MKTLLILSAVLSCLLAVTAAAAAVGDAEVAPEQLLKDSPVAVEEVGVPVVEEEQPTTMSPEEEFSSPEVRFFYCPPGWLQHKDGCYMYVRAPATWNNAAVSCTSFGGSLAPARDLFDYSLLQHLTRRGGSETAWIGGFYLEGWRWADHSPFRYTNWRIRYPDSSNRCVFLNAFAGWSNAYCGERRPYICKKNICSC